jgi:UDP-N-acetylglucosamine acyltransferase
MPVIHPTASVSKDCVLADSVEIGPYCVLSGPVTLGKGVRLLGNNYLMGPATIGDETILYPFTCVGFPPQDVKFKLGDRTAGVVIGRQGILREHVTIHAASNDHTPTRVGDRVFMMVNTHLGHDVQAGDNIVMVNNSAVGGHGIIGDNVILSGGTLVHQYCRIGRLAMMAGGVAVSADIPPFCLADERNRLRGINKIGLRRFGIPREQITEISRAFRDAIRPALAKDEMIRILEERAEACPPIAEMARFIAEAKRPICPGHGKVPRMLMTWLHRLRRGETTFAGLAEGEDFEDD